MSTANTEINLSEVTPAQSAENRATVVESMMNSRIFRRMLDSPSPLLYLPATVIVLGHAVGLAATHPQLDQEWQR